MYGALSDEQIRAFYRAEKPRLEVLSRRIGGTVLEADDLLSDAIVSVLSHWKKGTGPTTQLASYLAQSMRNRVLDEYRSPRRRTLPYAEVPEQLAPESAESQAVERFYEASLLKRAIQRVPEEQQLVLVRIVVDGEKPGDVARALGRNPSSIYMLLFRAKQALRRTLLHELIRANGGAESCSEALNRSGKGPAGEAVWEASPHVRDCPACQKAIDGWQDLASSLH